MSIEKIKWRHQHTIKHFIMEATTTFQQRPNNAQRPYKASNYSNNNDYNKRVNVRKRCWIQIEWLVLDGFVVVVFWNILIKKRPVRKYNKTIHWDFQKKIFVELYLHFDNTGLIIQVDSTGLIIQGRFYRADYTRNIP